MGDRNSSNRILCVNCNICVNKVRRYQVLTLDISVTSLISTWVDPVIITENDYICQACKDLAMAAVSSSSSSSLGNDESGSGDQCAAPSHRGHQHVCLLCGCSLLRKRSEKILRENPNDLQQSIIDIIENSVAPRKITESDRICHACRLRTSRDALRILKAEEAKSDLVVPIKSEVDQPPEPVSIQEDKVPALKLPNYRRAENTNTRCVFPYCSNTSLREISDPLRAVVLCNHKFYLPELCRICDEHLQSFEWDTLFHSEVSIQTFTAKHIQHILSLV